MSNYDWSQWNMTGKIRILMESNAAHPMAQYSIAAKVTGSAATTVSSLASRMCLSCSIATAAGPTVRGDALAGPNPTYDPAKASTQANYSEDASSPTQRQDSEATMQVFYESDDTPPSQD
jgi:hypothetical protein